MRNPESPKSRCVLLALAAAFVFPYQPMVIADPPAKAPSAQEQATIRAIQCFDNLRQIGSGITVYTTEHHGKYPPDLGTMMVAEKLPLSIFICPAAGGALPKDWKTLKPDDQAKWVNQHTDYIYAGAKWSLEDSHSSDPLVYEKDDDHGGTSINVLFANGQVMFLKLSDLRKHLGDKFATQRTTTREKPAKGEAPAIPLITMDQARAMLAAADMANLRKALFSFELDNGRFPTMAEGLDALVHKPAKDSAGWRQQVTELPTDPWGHPYHYQIPGSNGRDFDLFSAGPDGKPGTTDDVK